MVAPLLRMVAKLETKEIAPVIGSFLMAFLLTASYSMLKPVRDAMISDWTDGGVSTLWTINFVLSFVIIALYGWIASKVRLKWLVPGVYLFFALTFIAFYLAYQTAPEGFRELLAKAYYVWVSVFALYYLSVFWSFMSQIYTRDQALRLFAMIAVGVSAGNIVGPGVTALFSKQLGAANIVLLAGGLMLLALPIIMLLNGMLGETQDESAGETKGLSDKALGGNFYAGFAEFVTNRQLLGIGLFIFIYTGIGSFVYFSQKQVLADFNETRRIQIWAMLDLSINVMTFVIGLLITNHLVRWMGLRKALAIIPVLVAAGLLMVAGSPVVWMIVGLQFVRRVGNYAVTRPSREMLFTGISREARFKAKPVVDIICYRGGDVFWAWCFTLLTAGLKLGLGSVALIGAGLASVWAILGYVLGRQFEKTQNLPDTARSTDESAVSV